jgi:hypothetical protein
MGSDYQFFTEWRVPATIDEVKDVLGDADALPRWWPAVYLQIRELRDEGPDGTGKEVDVYTKGYMPYTLRWRMLITEPLTDAGFALAASGDLEGTGKWTFAQDGPEVVITYDWRIRATKPLLQKLTWLLRPFFSANHVWAMRRGEESLRLELRRRRARTEAELAKVPPPPPTTFRRFVRRAAW